MPITCARVHAFCLTYICAIYLPAGTAGLGRCAPPIHQTKGGRGVHAHVSAQHELVLRQTELAAL